MKRSYLLPMLSGIFIGTSYIPFPPWATLFAFVPLWLYWLEEESTKKIFFSGWITQFLLTLIGFNWVAHVAHEFGKLPYPLAIGALLIFCAVANLYIPLAGLAWAYCRKKLNLTAPHLILLLPLWTYFFEYFFPRLFPWNYGYTWMWVQMPFFQLAEWIGFTGLSFISLIFNGLFLKAWLLRKKQKLTVTVPALLLIFLAFNGVGWFILKSQPPNDDQARVMVNQGNIGNLEKVYAEQGWGFRDHIANIYFRIVREAVKNSEEKIDFAVWPETAYTEKITKDYEGMKKARKLSDFLNDVGIGLVTGAYSKGPRTGKTTNSLFAFDAQGVMHPEFYSKNKLLMFGEYVPGAETFPQILDMIPAGDFEAGEGSLILPVNRFKIGPQVCYEGLFPEYSRDAAGLGAQIFVNVTNDSWYGTWQEPFQHMMMTLARAVEFRRPLIRATNTGISTVVLASGEVLEQSPFHQEWTGVYEIPFRKSPHSTLFQKLPWLSPFLAVLLLIVITGRSFFVRFKKS